MRLKSIVYLPGDFVVKKVSAPVCAGLGQCSGTKGLVFELVRGLGRGVFGLPWSGVWDLFSWQVHAQRNYLTVFLEEPLKSLNH